MKIPANGFTHAGKFHADDVFATALLQILRPDIKITRGFTVPDDFDGIVYDIGFGMFDHHERTPRYSEILPFFCVRAYTLRRDSKGLGPLAHRLWHKV